MAHSSTASAFLVVSHRWIVEAVAEVRCYGRSNGSYDCSHLELQITKCTVVVEHTRITAGDTDGADEVEEEESAGDDRLATPVFE